MEHVNPVILIAVVIQTLISRVSHIAGSIAGYLITTGILVWGLGLYNEGDAVAVFGVVLSKSVFMYGCFFWYAYDTYVLFNGRAAAPEEAENEFSDSETCQEL